MRLLLDTHVAIWALSRPHRLSSKIEAMIADGQNAIFISVVGIWEIAIKSSLNRILRIWMRQAWPTYALEPPLRYCP